MHCMSYVRHCWSLAEWRPSKLDDNDDDKYHIILHCVYYSCLHRSNWMSDSHRWQQLQESEKVFNKTTVA